MPLFFTGLWSFIQRLKVAPVISVVLLIALLIQTVRIEGFLWVDGFKRETQEAKRNLAEARAEIVRMTTAQNEQVKRTETNVQRVEQSRNPVAEQIEAAPVEDGCKTPGLDLGRAEL